MQRNHILALSLPAHAEKVKVSAEIKNIEFGLVRSVQQSRTQTGPPAYHLPEFRFALYFLEENQIQHFRHVNPGIQHIHGNGDLREFLRIGKIVNRVLRVIQIVVDNRRVTGQMRVFPVKDFQNFLRVPVAFRKNNALADLFAIVDFQAVRHERVQYLANGVLVEQPGVQRGSGDAVRTFAVFIRKRRFILRFFRLGKFVVLYPLFQKFQFAFNRQVIYQKAVPDRLRQIIAVCRNAVRQFKYIVGVLVNFVFGRGGQSHKRRVKPVENVPVLVINRPVGFVTDQQIKMSASEHFPLLIGTGVNQIVHRLVGGKYAVRVVIVFFLHQICHGQIWQQIHKSAFCLCHQ